MYKVHSASVDWSRRSENIQALLKISANEHRSTVTSRQRSRRKFLVGRWIFKHLFKIGDNEYWSTDASAFGILRQSAKFRKDRFTEFRGTPVLWEVRKYGRKNSGGVPYWRNSFDILTTWWRGVQVQDDSYIMMRATTTTTMWLGLQLHDGEGCNYIVTRAATT